MMAYGTQRCAGSLVKRFVADKPYACLSHRQKTHPVTWPTTYQHRLFAKASVCNRKLVLDQNCAHINDVYGNRSQTCGLHTSNYNGSIGSYFASLASCSNAKMIPSTSETSSSGQYNEFAFNSTINEPAPIDRSVILDPFAKEEIGTSGAETFQFPSFESGNVVDVVTAEGSNVTAVGVETLSSLGLGSNVTPVGWIQQTLELLHVDLGLPWWGSIVCCTILFRSLVFPLALKGIRGSVEMQAFQAEMLPLQQKMVAAQNQMTPQLQEQLMKEYADLMQKHGNPFVKMLTTPLIQAPLFISFFLALRKMAEVPVASLATGGLLWFPDLIVPDPYHILPFVSAGTILLALELGFTDAGAVDMQQQQKMVRFFFRGMCVVMVPIMWNFPAAVVTYWVTSNFFTLFQGIMLRQPVVRNFFNLPEKLTPPVNPYAGEEPNKRSFSEDFKAAYEKARELKLRELEEMERAKELKLRELEEMERTMDQQSDRVEDSSRIEKNKRLFEEAQRKD